VLDCHLAHTIIPGLPGCNIARQPRSFPRQPLPSPSPYCRLSLSLPPPLSPRRAGYAAPSRLGCRFNPGYFVGTRPPSRGSPRRKGPRLHAIVDRPPSLTPSADPRLGVGKWHQELHRCALSGFLGPPSVMVRPTQDTAPPTSQQHSSGDAGRTGARSLHDSIRLSRRQGARP
jgi:hypothetical protein